jgi:hypothetical protein
MGSGTKPAPTSAPPAVIQVDIGRGSRRVLLVYVPLFALFVAGFVHVAVGAADTTTAVIGWVFATLFSLPLIVVALSLSRLLSPRSMDFDAAGLRYREGDASVFLPWEEVTGVGIGYDEPPAVASLRPGTHLTNALLDAAKVERRRHLAIEVFPANPDALGQHPLLMRFRNDQPSPKPELSPGRWRFPLPPAPGLPAMVARGVESYQASRWLGWFSRR